MTTQVMASPQSARIAKIAGRILKHAVPQEVIGMCCKSMKERLPPKSSDTIVFRRWLPKGATVSTPNTWTVDPAGHLLVEGETPQAETVAAQEITVTMQQYGVLYRYSDRVDDLYEDDVPSAMVELTGQRMGLLIEMVRYGILKAGTNVYRAGGVASRALTNGLVGANQLNLIARGLSSNLAQKMTKILAPSQLIGTTSIEAAYVACCHSDLETDWRALPGFTHVSDYGSRVPIHDNELGSWQQFRVVTSPHLASYLQAGAVAGAANTRLSNGVVDGGAACDVYPILIMAEEAYGDVMLRGKESITAYHMRPNEQSKDDPLGQRGHVGAKTYFTAVRLNELHMAVYEVAASYAA